MQVSSINFGTTSHVQKNNHNMHHAPEVKQPDAPTKVKAGVLATTILGVAGGVAMCFKRNGHSTNPVKILKDIKNSGFGKLDYDWKNVITIATSSVVGGLAGGAIFDKKENMKAKIREASIQVLANILIPLGCVAGGTKFYDKKIQTPLLKKLKQFTKDGKVNTNGKLANMLKVATTALCLGTAIVGGNKVTNIMNEKIYNIKDDRKVKIADFSGHIDDSCLAITTGFGAQNVVGKVVSRIIPIALMVSGYSTGVVQEWPDDIKESRKADPTKPFRL